MRVLQLSKTNGPPLLQSEEMPDLNLSGSSTSFDENSCLNQSISGVRAGSEGKTGIESESLQRPELNISQDCCNTSVGCNDGLPSGIVSQESDNSFSKIAGVNQLRQSKFNGSERSIISGDSVENTSTDILSENQGVPFLFPGKDASAASDTSKDLKPNPQICTEDTSMLPDYLKLVDNQSDNESKLLPISVVLNEDLDCSDERTVPVDVSEDVASSLAGSEPIYEGEECILDSGHLVYENREPMYEGEIVLAEQTDREAEGDACGPHSKDEITLQHSKKLHNINAEKGRSCLYHLIFSSYVVFKIIERHPIISFLPCVVINGTALFCNCSGELIRNFLKNNASQLTICGYVCKVSFTLQYLLFPFMRLSIVSD